MNVPKAEHVAGYRGVCIVEIIIAHRSPFSVVFDLKSALVVVSSCTAQANVI